MPDLFQGTLDALKIGYSCRINDLQQFPNLRKQGVFDKGIGAIFSLFFFFFFHPDSFLFSRCSNEDGSEAFLGLNEQLKAMDNLLITPDSSRASDTVRLR